MVSGFEQEEVVVEGMSFYCKGSWEETCYCTGLLHKMMVCRVGAICALVASSLFGIQYKT